MGILKDIELAPFQKIGAENLASNFHHLLADEPGLGKTLQILAAVAFHKFKRSAVVCPAGVRSHWKDTIKRVGLSLDNFHVDSYEAATNGQFPAGPYDAAIMDECFPAGTSVLTSSGLRDIVDISPGDLVASCNLSTNGVEYKQVARTVGILRRGHLVEVVHESGKFICTSNHKIYVEGRGYEEAGNLSSDTALRMVRGPVHVEGEKTPLLPRELRGSVSVVPPGSKRGFCQAHPVKAALASRIEGQGSLSTYDVKQPHEEHGYEGQDDSIVKGADFPCTGREWKDHGPTGDFSREGARSYGICHSDNGSERLLLDSPKSLQSGHRFSEVKDCDRGGRTDTQNQKVEVPGPSENRGFGVSRVVSVKILERRDFEGLGLGGGTDRTVYNIEVDDNHNYFAEGVLVSNCHYLKNADSLRTQALFGNELGLARQARFKWPLTGTPFLKRPREVYPVLKCLHEPALLKAGIKNFDDYAHRFCGGHYDGREFNTKGATNLDQLRLLMGSFMTRRTVDEVMPELPPILLSLIPLELSSDERAPIDEIESEILNREAFMSSVREDYMAMGDSAKLRRATGQAMAKQAADLIEDKINCGAGKVVVFFRHTAVGRILEQELGHRFPVFFAGGMSDAQKDKAKKTFMEKDGDCEVFLGQMQASGTGIDGLQTCCHTVVDVEPDWVTEDMRQRFARLRRMGMDLGRPVNAYILYVPGTIQAAIIEVNAREAKTIEKLVNTSATHIVKPAELSIEELMGDL